MELFDDGLEAEDEEWAFSSFSVVPREIARRFWSEPAWSAQPGEELGSGAALFSDERAEMELRAEMRLSQLWNRCRAGDVTLAEWGELAHLIYQVEGIEGLMCTDCATLELPDIASNWALGDTMLCRSHLRIALGHARVGEDGAA